MTEEVVEEKKMVDESAVIQTIVIGSDWQEVITTLVAEEGMDPLALDIVKLAAAFARYLEQMTRFDFRVPARFILVAAILLRMKAELLLDEEEERILKSEGVQPLKIEDVPSLLPPLTRKSTKRVTLTDLLGALNKAFDFQERKEDKKLRMRRAIERLIVPEQDIEIRIKDIYERINKSKETTFSELVPSWKRMDIVKTFLPILHLSTRGLIECDQEELFKEIKIKVRTKDTAPQPV